MLKTRMITALCLLPLVIAALFWLPTPGWAFFSGVVVLLGLWEWARFFRYNLGQHIAYLGVAGLLLALAWHSGYTLGLLEQSTVLLLWCVLAPLWLVRQWRLHNRIAAAVLGYALLLPTWFALTGWRVDPVDGARLLAVMALVWIADTAAYFTGKAFGRHKLAPAISPGKSWEGVLGALLICTLYAIALSYSTVLGFSYPWWAWVLLAWVLTAVSIVGDLLESWFKRVAGVKDSSGLLPGHGGVLDRIDSLIAVLAVSYAFHYFAGA